MLRAVDLIGKDETMKTLEQFAYYYIITVVYLGEQHLSKRSVVNVNFALG